MWSKKEILDYSGIDGNLGTFNRGLPKLIDLLKYPFSIPRVYSKRERVIDVCAHSPEIEIDGLTVCNFRKRLEELYKLYSNMKEIPPTIVWANFSKINLENKEDDQKFLTTFVKYGCLSFRLNFFTGKEKRLYRVKTQEYKPKFAEVMEDVFQSNDTEKIFY